METRAKLSIDKSTTYRQKKMATSKESTTTENLLTRESPVIRKVTFQKKVNLTENQKNRAKMWHMLNKNNKSLDTKEGKLACLNLGLELTCSEFALRRESRPVLSIPDTKLKLPR